MKLPVAPSCRIRDVGEAITPFSSSSSRPMLATCSTSLSLAVFCCSASPSTAIVSLPSATSSCRGVTVSSTVSVPVVWPAGIVICRFVGSQAAV